MREFRYFVTGTDTEVGKTFLSAAICMRTNAEYWKPIQCGTAEGTDRDFIAKMTSVKTHVEKYCLAKPASPNQAAAAERQLISVREIIAALPEAKDLIIEGAGGLYVPLNSSETILDLIRGLGMPVILAARSGLGTLNHTLLTVKALESEGVELRGVVLIGEPHAENRETLSEFGVRIIGEIPHYSELSPTAVADAAERIRL